MSTGPTSAETTALLLESPRLLSVDEYHRMIEAGIFAEDEHVELLEGVVVAMTPQSPAHAYCIKWLTRFLARTLGDAYDVRPQLPLTLGDRNEPEPDLAVVRADTDSRDRHPATAVLAIEVSGPSLRKDRGVKAGVYARFGISEYWIVNVDGRVVEVLSDPDVVTGAYRRARPVTTEETLTSEALPELSFAVARLFG
jgi:Uma2 family endonuclease